MKKNPRQTAVDILIRVDEGSYAEPLIDKYLAGEGWQNIHDRRLLTQLVYGVLRMRGRLDWLIEKLYRGRFEKMESGLKNILRTGLYQLLCMDRIPDHAAVDETVRMTKKRFPGRDALVNAILRSALRMSASVHYPDLEEAPAGHIAVVHSHPLWLVERWIALFGVDETLALCRADNENAALCIRANRLKTSRQSLVDVFTQQGCEARLTGFSPDGIFLSNLSHPIRETEPYRKGCLQIQDEASQLVSRIVDPQPDEGILDVCSGVGGKTTHMAELMKNTGSILAVDIQKNKLKALEGLTRRLGITIIQPKVADAAEDLGTEFQGRFDRVLVDAPCSGLGTLRRNPEIKWRLQKDEIAKFPELQKKILDRSSRYVKAGGFLIYSTCTIMPEENDDVVGDFLASHPDFRLVAVSESMPAELTDESGFLKTYPHRHGMDGFFAAKLRKG